MHERDQANADGTASQALEDRTRTAIALYKAKLAPLLIFPGGSGAGAVSEPEAMRWMALAEGVPDSAIVLDEAGLNTDATVANTAALFERRHLKSALAVSRSYHLPRVKMAYARALSGKSVDVYTVPATESQPLTAKPSFMAREVVALWVYYLRPLETEINHAKQAIIRATAWPHQICRSCRIFFRPGAGRPFRP